MSSHDPEQTPGEPTAKVILYIVADGRLLMFRRPQLANQGLQVPGGTVEPGEEPQRAALREAVEETGLTDLRLEGLLGTASYVTKEPPGARHLRHFFHLSRARAEPRVWTHFENPTAGARPSAPYELFWEPLETARPDWEMDAYLSVLRAHHRR